MKAMFASESWVTCSPVDTGLAEGSLGSRTEAWQPAGQQPQLPALSLLKCGSWAGRKKDSSQKAGRHYMADVACE